MIKKMGIILLNYLNYEDTIECLNSLKAQTVKNISIVIVDNGSNNSSVRKIKKEIGNSDNIFLIQSDKNLGFARGNNLGINFLKNKLYIDNILLCNNDLVFSDSTFLDKLQRQSIAADVGAVGTSIIGKLFKNQNPAFWDFSKKSIISEIQSLEPQEPSFKQKVKNELLKSSFFFSLKNFKIKYQENLLIKKNEKDNLLTSCESKQILSKKNLLHGSAILLTSNYFRVFPYLYPKTFLYGEEMVLKILFEKAKLKMLFIPDISIDHKEDKSSDLSFEGKNEELGHLYRKQSDELILELFDKELKDIQAEFY
ncbi:MAG: glycosyltransferase [Liquorilactobacillus sp.]|uniref:glycosyltransferase n=3 Tax=Liquorilactobacillus sp. TaxID=2767923 RepID=UPI0039EB41FA